MLRWIRAATFYHWRHATVQRVVAREDVVQMHLAHPTAQTLECPLTDALAKVPATFEEHAIAKVPVVDEQAVVLEMAPAQTGIQSE